MEPKSQNRGLDRLFGTGRKRYAIGPALAFVAVYEGMRIVDAIQLDVLHRTSDVPPHTFGAIGALSIGGGMVLEEGANRLRAFRAARLQAQETPPA